LQQSLGDNGPPALAAEGRLDVEQSQRLAPFFDTIRALPAHWNGAPRSMGQAMKTYTAKAENVVHGWYVVDAQNKVLGRLAAQLAMRLRGKHRPEYTPHVDTGDYIVVLNAAKIRVTGRKALGKKYYRHTTYPGGIKETDFAKLQAKFPHRALQRAVKGMLPKGPLGYAMLRKLKIYADATHPHGAQQPKALEI
jgi:large subunit ribosomal protein L13